MSEYRPVSNDKTVVQRRVAQGGEKARHAVKSLRAGLGYHNASQDDLARPFLVDLLRAHARQQLQYRYALMLMACFGAYFMHFSIPWGLVAAWLILSLLVCAMILSSSVQILDMKDDEVDVEHWNRLFLAMHATIGICWASVFALHPMANAEGFNTAFGFAGTLVLTAIALLTNKYLKYGVLAASFPLVIVLVIRLTPMGSISSFGMIAVLITACFFFHYIADMMRSFDIDHLRAAAERDQLIMELENARAISDEARRRAEESNLAKSRFLATMSHELRTPLNAILGFSEVMSNEVMGPINNKHYKEYVADIHSSGTHLLNLINEILDLSRVEAGRYKLNEEACTLLEAVDQAHQMVKLRAAQKNINLVIQVQPDLPQIWADEKAMRQVILNLLSNALKFTPSGGTVTLKCGWTAGGGQYLSVEDNGPGIAEEEIPIVLSQFGQGSIAIKSAEQGTGLGLPIVQALVQMHDGTFDLTSKLREGTKVLITFPRTRILEVVPAMPQQASAPDRWSHSALGKRRFKAA
ncbi:MAG: HAMP domain-containing sensor histidine kinase [Ahrensia sp.]|nr:HAMP domain-containing sensor histidine kinase [Ahrensia sp.]